MKIWLMKNWGWILLATVGFIGLLTFALCRAAGIASRMEEELKMRDHDYPTR